MTLWNLTSRSRRFIVAIMLGCFFTVISSAYACVAQCVAVGSGQHAPAARDASHASAGDEDGSHQVSEQHSQYLHAGACHLAWTPGAFAHSQWSSLYGVAARWADWRAEKFASFVPAPPEHRPKGFDTAA